MRPRKLLLSIAALFALLACDRRGLPNAPAYSPPPGFNSETAARLEEGHVETGFLVWGQTKIQVALIDFRKPDTARPVPVTPGAHKILIVAYRDPVLAYLCTTYKLEAGKSYVAQSTEPFMETTTLWIEEKSSGAVVGEKHAAIIVRRPAMFNPDLSRLLWGDMNVAC